MPNWCRNILKVSGPEQDVAKFKKEAVGFYPWGLPQPGQKPEILSFHSLMPVPKEILAQGYHAAGYDWQVKHWGCKWAACRAFIDTEEPGCIYYWFETPWTPPFCFLKWVSGNRPTLCFDISYTEEMGTFRGEATAQAGVLKNKFETDLRCDQEKE